MIRVLIFILVMAPVFTKAQDALLMDIRQNIVEVFKYDSVCTGLYQRIAETDVSHHTLLTGYKGSLSMGMALHDINAFNKLSYFNDGKKLIEESIQREPENLELRFLRLTIQTNLPKFLGYSDSKESDKEFVLAGLEDIKSPELKSQIRNFISAAEKDGKL